jgi:NB-ARC domain/Leucine rich repeat
MEFLRTTMNETIPLVVATIFEHAAYPFQVDNKIRDLVTATRDLAAMEEDVKTSIINAEWDDCSPTKQVEEWLVKVEAIRKVAEEIPQNFHKRRRSIWSDYTTSRSVVKKLREVKSLCDQRTVIEVTMNIPPPLAQELPASSTKSPNLDLALQYIKDDVHSIIGIYGMGGVGKTHLLKQINNKLSKDSSINLVIFITCSKECSEEKIQDEIIDKLGLKKKSSMEQKQITLFNFLKKRSFVLLLDDLWSRMDLEIVGIPPVLLAITGTCKQKIVLTTRSTDVCGLMEVKKTIRVDVLNWDGAWNLFKEKATAETIESHPFIQKYAVEVMKELGGLPLALITVGRAMYDKRDPCEWELAVELLRQARLNDIELSGTDETVFKVLKFSFDKLRSDNLRECFLHCSLWPEDNMIEKNELVELWMGLGLIDEPDVNMAYNVGYSYISRLQAVCLLETTDKESQVKLHDVIRDMSLWIISNEGTEKNKWLVGSSLSEIFIQRETEKISLMDQKNSISFSTTCYDSKLTTLLFIPNNLNDIKVLPFQSFSKLTVLNLRGNRFEVFPVEICGLRSLQFIDLSGNEIKSLPNEVGELTNLKYLFLRGNIIRTFPVGALSKMKSLRILDLTRRFGHYKMIYQIKLDFVPSLLEELQSFPEFGAVGIEINDMIQFRKLTELSNVPVRWLTITMWEELSTFSIPHWFLETYQSKNNLFSLNITNMEAEHVIFESACRKPCRCQFGRLEELYMFSGTMKDVVWKGLDPKDVLPRLKRLTIHTCNRLMNISWVIHLPCLQELKVIQCYGIKKLIHVDKEEPIEPTFPFLKLLELMHLSSLETICNPQITFPALESIKISACKKLKKLPFRADNVPRKLNCIQVNENWWNNFEWDEDSMKSSLSGLVRFVF